MKKFIRYSSYVLLLALFVSACQHSIPNESESVSESNTLFTDTETVGENLNIETEIFGQPSLDLSLEGFDKDTVEDPYAAMVEFFEKFDEIEPNYMRDYPEATKVERHVTFCNKVKEGEIQLPSPRINGERIQTRYYGYELYGYKYPTLVTQTTDDQLISIWAYYIPALYDYDYDLLNEATDREIIEKWDSINTVYSVVDNCDLETVPYESGNIEAYTRYRVGLENSQGEKYNLYQRYFCTDEWVVEIWSYELAPTDEFWASFSFE